MSDRSPPVTNAMNPSSPSRAEALIAARSWFSLPEQAPTYDAFQSVYLTYPRLLFLEVALHRVGRPVRRVLDVGCGTGESLAFLAERLPGAEIVGLEPEGEMIERAAARIGGRARLVQATLSDLGRGPASAAVRAELGNFDLILSYSTFRFWDEPDVSLSRLEDLLSPGGLSYVQDLRRDIPSELRAHLLEQMPNAAFGRFLAEQFDASYSIDEVKEILGASTLRGADLSAGGFAGFAAQSPEAFAVIQRNQRIARLLFQAPSQGFRGPRGSEAVFHLFVRGRERQGWT